MGAEGVLSATARRRPPAPRCRWNRIEARSRRGTVVRRRPSSPGTACFARGTRRPGQSCVGGHLLKPIPLPSEGRRDGVLGAARVSPSGAHHESALVHAISRPGRRVPANRGGRVPTPALGVPRIDHDLKLQVAGVASRWGPGGRNPVGLAKCGRSAARRRRSGKAAWAPHARDRVCGLTDDQVHQIR
jgi:hypothetical protein